MLARIGNKIRTRYSLMRESAAAKEAARQDIRQGLGSDPGIDIAVAAAIDWLGRAQDKSTTNDGGVARHYSLVKGWGPSYPETTGYIVPTMIAAAKRNKDDLLLDRARRMLDWLADIQLPGGGFQGGTIEVTPQVPVTFNTGQILIGLSSGVENFGERYLPAMHAAASWLAASQDPDGCWRKHPTPYAEFGEKTYETHVAWGLFEAARIDPSRGYGEAGLKNIAWALTNQTDNGWFKDCCLTDPEQPLTHTLGYALRGILEAYRYSGDPSLLQRAQKTAVGLLSAISVDGFLPGRLDAGWKGTVSWACLTGAVQIAHCWLLLYQETGEVRFRDAAFAANAYVRKTMSLDPGDTCGAIKGSFPVSGQYGQYQYLNWAAKFFIDANLLEKSVRGA